MSKDSPAGDAGDLALRRTDMAFARTRWAADRTLLAADRTFIAWLLLATAMIGFGVVIGEAGDLLVAQGIAVDRFPGLRLLGLAFIGLAVLGLVGALSLDRRIAKRLANDGFKRVERTPLRLLMGGLMIAVAILAGALVAL